MKKVGLLIGILVLILMLLVGCGLLGKNPKGNWDLVGTVLNLDTKTPLKNAKVNLGEKIVQTDEKGHFTFTVLDQSLYTLKISIEGFETYLQNITREGTSTELTVFMKPLKPVNQAIDLSNGGSISNNGIELSFSAGVSTGQVEVTYNPFRKIDQLSLLSDTEEELVTLQSVSEVYFEGNLQELNIPIDITLSRDALLDSEGEIISLQNIRGEIVPLSELVVDIEDLYSPDETNVTIHIENLDDYLQPMNEADLQALGYDGASLQFFGMFKLLIEKLTVNWSHVHPPVKQWLEEKKDNIDKIVPKNTVKSENLLIYVHGLGSEYTEYFYSHYSSMMNDFTAEIFMFKYFSAAPIPCSGQKLAEIIESLQKNYNHIYLIAHSLGGLVVHEALYYAEKNSLSYINKVDKVVLLGSPLAGMPSMVAKAGALSWSMNAAWDSTVSSIVANKLSTEKTYKALLTSAVRSSMREQSSYFGVIGGIRDVVRNANLFTKHNIDLYLLAGTNPANLIEMFFQNGYNDPSVVWFYDIVSTAALAMIYSASYSNNIASWQHDGLVSTVSALNQNEAKEKATVSLNHYSIMFSDTDAYNWCVKWLKDQ